MKGTIFTLTTEAGKGRIHSLTFSVHVPDDVKFNPTPGVIACIVEKYLAGLGCEVLIRAKSSMSTLSESNASS